MKENKVNVKAAIIGSVIFLILAGGALCGYMYYDTVYLPAQNEKKYAVEDIEEPIETMVIYSDQSDSIDRGKIIEIAAAMEDSPAKFFLHDGGGRGDVKGCIVSNVQQTDKENYETTLGVEAEEANEVFVADMTAFLNTNYSKIDKHTFYRGKFGQLETKNMFDQSRGWSCVDYACESWGDYFSMDESDSTPYEDPNYYSYADEFFGTQIAQYFIDHELKLSCDNVEMIKVSGGKIDYGRPLEKMDPRTAYYFVGYADVTTEHAVGDLSDMGIFGEEGETVKIKIIAAGSDYGLSGISLTMAQ